MNWSLNNKYAILRDLSVAQGRKVPADIVGSAGDNQRPPAIKIKEETEEEFFRNGASDDHVPTEPDLKSIKEMLNMVNVYSEESNPVAEIGKVVQISKLNPLCNDFVPNNIIISGIRDGVCTGQSTNKVESAIAIKQKSTKPELKPRKKRRENVALKSFLDLELVQANVDSKKNKEMTEISTKPEVKNGLDATEVKLLKPSDFISNMECEEKVNKWLQEPVLPRAPEPTLSLVNKPTLSPVNMFQKKKSITPLLDSTSMFKKKNGDISRNNSETEPAVRPGEKVFVPSSIASEYYKKYLEHQQQEKEREDLWKRAQREMQEIDKRRLQEKEQAMAQALESQVETLESQVQSLEDIATEDLPPLPMHVPGLADPGVRRKLQLPVHRHDLPQECAVCLVFCKTDFGK